MSKPGPLPPYLEENPSRAYHLYPRISPVPNSDARAVTVRRWLELVALAPLGLREICKSRSLFWAARRVDAPGWQRGQRRGREGGE